jgi:uncharacterized protein YaeQ
MAQTATLYSVHVDLADMNRNVYESLDLRLARHPSETAEFMVTRLLAYCLEFREGIAFTEGVSSGVEPAVIARDLTGNVTAWIEVGLPDPARLNRASKAAEYVAVYTHRDVRQFLGQCEGQRIHRAEAIVVRAFDRAAIERVATLIDRRSSFAVAVSGSEIDLAFDRESVTVTVTEHVLTAA